MSATDPHDFKTPDVTGPLDVSSASFSHNTKTTSAQVTKDKMSADTLNEILMRQLVVTKRIQYLRETGAYEAWQWQFDLFKQ